MSSEALGAGFGDEGSVWSVGSVQRRGQQWQLECRKDALVPESQRLILKHGRVVNGSATPPVGRDVLIQDGKIIQVDSTIDTEPADVVDATGLDVTPGFIDSHTHDDLAVLRDVDHAPKLLQGATTVLVGNCGHGVAPVPDDPAAMAQYSSPVLGPFPTPLPWRDFPSYLDTLAADARGTNTSALVPHGALRAAICGYRPRAADDAEIARMNVLLEEALAAGASGLSLGLMYAPGCHATSDELVALACTVARYGRVVACHLRNEGGGLLTSVDEFLDIARRSEVAAHVSHLKITGPDRHGELPRAIERLDGARADGVDVTADVYPYTAGSTTVASLFPPWSMDGGTDGFLAQMSSARSRAALAQAMRQPWDQMENHLLSLGPERITLAGFQLQEHRRHDGQSLAAIANERAQDPIDSLLDLVEAERAQLTLIQFQSSEDDLRAALVWPWTMIGSDGLPLTGASVHPRHYGTFPRILARYVRDLEDLSLPEAVRKMTALPAERFGLRDRGRVEPGRVADLCLFDPHKVQDQATYEQPQQPPRGIEAVIVAGRIVARGPHATGRAGQLLRQ